MDYRPLDITVISASGLDNFLLFFKAKVYVVVSLLNGNTVIEKKTHSTHGRNPRWNHRLKFPIEESAIRTSTLLFVLRQHRLLGDKDIGEVSIPVYELFEASGSETTEHEVDYQVQSMRGKSKGTFTFSHQFLGKAKSPYNYKPSDDDSYSVNSYATTTPGGSCHPPSPYMMNQQGMVPSYPQAPYSQPLGYGYAPPGTQYGGSWYQPPPPPPPGAYPYPPPQQVGYNQPGHQQTKSTD